MKRYIYSPYFTSIFEDNTSPITIIDANIETSLDNLRDAVTFQLSEKKKCVIAVADDEYDDIRNYFRTQDFPILEFKGIKELKYVEDSLSGVEYSKFDLELDLLHQSITDYYIGLYKQNVNNKSLFQIINQEVKSSSNAKEIDTEGLFEFKDGEYLNLLNLVNEAFSLYDNEYNNVNKEQKGFSLSQIVIPRDLSIENLLSVYLNDYDTIYKLRGEYLDAIADEKSLLRDQSKKKFDLLEEQLFVLKLEYHEFTFEYGIEKIEKPSIFTFDKYLKERFEKWITIREKIESTLKEFAKNNFNLALPDEIGSIQALDSLIIKLDKKYKSWWIDSEKEIAESIKRINHINEFNPKFLTLYRSLTEKIKLFNEKKIYSLFFECNARSTLKQVEFLDQVLSYMAGEIKDLERIPKYNNWKLFFDNSSPSFQRLLKQLLVFDKADWYEIFTYNYEKNLIETKNAASVYLDKSKLDRFEDIQSKLKRSTLKELKDQFDKGIFECQENLKKINPKLYKQWQKSKVISTPEFKDILDPYKYVNTILVPVSDIAKIGQSEKKTFLIGQNNYATRYDYQVMSKPDEDSKDVKTLVYNHEFYTDKIDDINITERIRSAKQLALSLLDINDNVRIFQTSFSNILCIDDGFIADCIFKAWKDNGIKEFRIGNDLKNGLIESIIMTDRPQYLVYSNGILSSEKLQHLPWQLEIINAYKMAGFNLLPIWTYETMGMINTIEYIKSRTKSVK